MGEIAKQQLQSVFARRECHGGLGLAATEMAMLIVLGHRLRQIRQRRIDQQVMMTGVIQLVAARLYAGQTTDFRTPGGGFAPVFVVSA